MALSRVLEPEVMDTPNEAHDYDTMDHSHVNRTMVDDLLAEIENPADVLDLGTGTALIPIELCQRRENCRVMAIDLSIHMLERAQFNVEMASLIDRIQLGQVDSKQLPYRDEMFDVVMSNSIIHHIPQPVVVLREAVRVTVGGGLLFFRDLLRPDNEADVQSLVAAYAGQENGHQQQMFNDSLRAALSLAEVQDLVELLGFARDTVQATSDRHWTWAVRRDGPQ
jgi:ubiquinone/menaquinone biosynthesis C-methylase UbiE